MARFGAVVTAGGRSSRLGPVGEVIPKGLLPLVGPGAGGPSETAIGRIVSALLAAGVTDVVIAGTDHPWFDLAADSYGARKVVVPPTGEFDAVRLGWQALPPCELGAVVSSDNVFPARGLEGFLAAPDPGTSLVAGAWKPEIRRYTEVTTTADSRFPLPRVAELVEKPDRDGGGLAKAGLYRFPGPVLDGLVARGVAQDRFGERSMTEALLRVMAGGPVVTHDLPANFLDIGTPAGLDEAIKALATERAASLLEAPS
jgi:dTDP-glucose pyrophosphorylase